jgi:hypothetical protein
LLRFPQQENFFLNCLTFLPLFAIFWDNHKLSFTWYAFEDTHIGSLSGLDAILSVLVIFILFCFQGEQWWLPTQNILVIPSTSSSINFLLALIICLEDLYIKVQELLCLFCQFLFVPPVPILSTYLLWHIFSCTCNCTRMATLLLSVSPLFPSLSGNPVA